MARPGVPDRALLPSNVRADGPEIAAKRHFVEGRWPATDIHNSAKVGIACGPLQLNNPRILSNVPNGAHSRDRRPRSYPEGHCHFAARRELDRLRRSGKRQGGRGKSTRSEARLGSDGLKHARDGGCRGDEANPATLSSHKNCGALHAFLKGS